MASPTRFAGLSRGTGGGSESVEPPELSDTAFAGTTSPTPQRRGSVDAPRATTTVLGEEWPSVIIERRRERGPTPTTSDGEGEEFEPGAGPPGTPAHGDVKKRVGRILPAKRRDGEISIVVGGQRFVVESKLFEHHPNTMLGRMFGSSLDLNMTRPNESGDYVIAQPVSASAFTAILNFYRRGEVLCPPNVSTEELSEACKYFLIPFTHQSIKCQNVRLFVFS